MGKWQNLVRGAKDVLKSGVRKTHGEDAYKIANGKSSYFHINKPYTGDDKKHLYTNSLIYCSAAVFVKKTDNKPIAAVHFEGDNIDDLHHVSNFLKNSGIAKDEVRGFLATNYGSGIDEIKAPALAEKRDYAREKLIEHFKENGYELQSQTQQVGKYFGYDSESKAPFQGDFPLLNLLKENSGRER
jgi:hypothetical protein